MDTFNDIALKLGWERPFEKVDLWTKHNRGDLYKCVFDTNNYVASFNPSARDNTEWVKNTIEKWWNPTIYKKEDESWILLMLASDYFAHKYDFNSELIWAKKAMKENKNLTPKQFSSVIREKLI